MTNRRRIRSTRSAGAPPGNRVRPERPRPLPADVWPSEIFDRSGSERGSLRDESSDDWFNEEPAPDTSQMPPAPIESPLNGVPQKTLHLRRHPRVARAAALAAVPLMAIGLIFRAELLKFATIGGNGLVLCGLLMVPLIVAYLTISLVRILVKRGRKALATFLCCFSLSFCGWLSVNVAAAWLCDGEIDRALAKLPPATAQIYYVHRGEKEEQIYLPADYRIDLAELNASYSTYTVPAIEDERIRSRWEGVLDLRSLLRAVRDTIFFHRKEGASTILVQAAKWIRIKNGDQTFGSRLKDKLLQWLLALRLWQRFPTPEEQIALYLNLVEVDGSHGMAYAAIDFFGAPLGRLTLEQSALLAGILNNPTDYNPRMHSDSARNRRNLVLDKMVNNGLAQDVGLKKAADLGLTNAASASRFAFFARIANKRTAK